MHLSNKKGKKVRGLPALSMESLDLLTTTPIRRRICLGICNGFLGVMGLACPFTVRIRLLMRNLFEGASRDLKFNDEIPENLLGPWRELISEAVLSDSLVFPMCARPTGAIGTPLVVGF